MELTLARHHPALKLGLSGTKIACLIPLLIGPVSDQPTLTLIGLVNVSAMMAVWLSKWVFGSVRILPALELTMIFSGLNVSLAIIYIEPLGLFRFGIEITNLLLFLSGISLLIGVISLWLLGQFRVRG